MGRFPRWLFSGGKCLEGANVQSRGLVHNLWFFFHSSSGSSRYLHPSGLLSYGMTGHLPPHPDVCPLYDSTLRGLSKCVFNKYKMTDRCLIGKTLYLGNGLTVRFRVMSRGRCPAEEQVYSSMPQIFLLFVRHRLFSRLAS